MEVLRSLENQDTLQQVADMTRGDKDLGSFYQLTRILAQQFTLGSICPAGVRQGYIEPCTPGLLSARQSDPLLCN